jgi:hypothetical protein
VHVDETHPAAFGLLGGDDAGKRRVVGAHALLSRRVGERRKRRDEQPCRRRAVVVTRSMSWLSRCGAPLTA